ncbi:DUF5677 domain-containing protein [Priestia megaterium]|uniref:DUF5677 domain-containing protein n=1 Tax=Priestia megaterium TaxID=1404 RepID=UPI0039C1F495
MEGYNYLLNKSEEIIQEILNEVNQEYIDDVDMKIIPLLLFRKILEKSKAIQILNDNKSGDSTLTLARSILENYWYLMFMLDEDTEFRSFSYCFFTVKEGANKQLSQVKSYIKSYYKYIETHKETISFCQSQIKDINESLTKTKILDKFIKKKSEDIKLTLKKTLEDEIDKLNKEILSNKKRISELNKEKKECDFVLKELNSGNKFIEIREEFTKIKNKVKKPNWYTLKTGIGNIYEVAANLELEDYYIEYALLSQEVHSSNATNQIDIEKGNIILKDFFDRDISEMTQNIAKKCLLDSLKDLLIFYEKENLITKIDNELFYKY